MRDSTTIVRDRQSAIRREMDRRGILLKTVALDAEMSGSTVASYFPADRDKEPALMSVAALYRLLETGAVPTDLLSLLLPEGHTIVRIPDGIDHDDFEESFRDFLSFKGRAHHPDSPGGREISDCEQAELDRKVVAIVAKAA